MRSRSTALRFRSFVLCLIAFAGAVSAVVAGEKPAQPENSTASRSAVLSMKSRDDLKVPFNEGQGKVRIVTFLSPTCKYCIQNANNLQKKVLDVLAGDNIEVHAVWLQVSSQDTRESVDPARVILHDTRVRHYWDEQRSLNMMLLDAIQFDVNVRLYDVFLLYGRDAVWDKRLPRPDFWMHEFRGAPGPLFDPAIFAEQVQKRLAGEPVDAQRR